MHFVASQGSHTWFIDVFMQGMCHYAEVLKRNLVDDKQPPVQEASQMEPVKSKSSSPLQHTPPKPKPYQPKNKISYDLNMSINRRSLKKKIATFKKIPLRSSPSVESWTASSNKELFILSFSRTDAIIWNQILQLDKFLQVRVFLFETSSRSGWLFERRHLFKVLIQWLGFTSTVC